MRSIELTWNGRKIDAGHVDVVEPAAVDEDQRIGGGERAEPAQVHGRAGAVDAAKEVGELHAGNLADDLLQRLRRRVRDLLRGDDGRGCADDAGELPDGRSASALSAALRRDVAAGPRRGIWVVGRRGIGRGAARARPFVKGWFGAGPVLVSGRVDFDRRQLIGGCGLLCLRNGNPERQQRREKTGGEQETAAPLGCDR